MSEHFFGSPAEGSFNFEQNASHTEYVARLKTDAYWNLQAAKHNFGISSSQDIKKWLECYINDTVLAERIAINKVLIGRLLGTIEPTELLSNVEHNGWFEAKRHEYVDVEVNGTQPYEFFVALANHEDRESFGIELEKLQQYERFAVDEIDIQARLKALYNQAPFTLILQPYMLSQDSQFSDEHEEYKIVQVAWRSQSGSLFANNSKQIDPFIYKAQPNIDDYNFGFSRWDNLEIDKSERIICNNYAQYAVQAKYERWWAESTPLARIIQPSIRPDDVDENLQVYYETKQTNKF